MKRDISFLVTFLLLLFTAPIQATSDDPFDVWMGSKTKHWSHLRQESEIAALENFRKLYHRHAPLIQLPKGSLKIPKVVHFIWLGPRPFPPSSVANVRSWMAQNPGWTFKFWTDRPRDPPCHGMETIMIKDYPFPFLERCYIASENWGEKSDILRFEILYQQGGIYVDHDANCLTPFDPYHHAYDFFCGLEAPHPPFVHRNLTAGNGVIASRPFHPVVKKVIELIEERWDPIAEKLAKNEYSHPTQVVIERTYLPLTEAIQLELDKPGNIDIVFPAAFFFAKKGLKPVLSQHFFANSWAGGKSDRARFEKETWQSLSKIEKKFHHLSLFQAATMTSSLLLICFGLFFLRIRRSQ